MNAEILKQEKLMNAALEKLAEIKTTEKLFKPVDSTRSELITGTLQHEYAEIMAKIGTSIIGIGIKLTV